MVATKELLEKFANIEAIYFSPEFASEEISEEEKVSYVLSFFLLVANLFWTFLARKEVFHNDFMVIQ